MLGGFEWIRPDADIYSTSSFNSKAAPANSIGLSVHYSVMGQTLSLVHLETAENLAANSSTTDKKVSGILLSNEFYEGIFSSRLSYHQTGTSLGDSDLWGGGIQLAKNFLLLQLDYLRAKNKKQGKNDSGGVVDAELETFVGYFRYNHENYQPFIKYSVDNSKGEYELSFDVSGARSQRTSLEFGVEFVPNKDEDMRYHIVYSMAQTKQKSSAQGTSFQKNENDTLFAGVKFGITLL